MSYAKICDCCGKVFSKNKFETDFGDDKCGTVRGVCVMFEETDKHNATQNTSYPYYQKRRNAYFDLCDDCARDVVRMLRKEE